MDERLVEQFRRIAGPDVVLHQAIQLLTYECDALPHLRETPALVVLPRSAAEVQAFVRLCVKEGLPFVARGHGTARLESATGQIETRSIQPGDILSLPRGRKHGFEKTGAENLVFLVVATPLPPGVEETTFHE